MAGTQASGNGQVMVLPAGTHRLTGRVTIADVPSGPLIGARVEVATGNAAAPADDQRMGLIGALAAEVMADAIVRAATQATSAAGIPALRDLPGAR